MNEAAHRMRFISIAWKALSVFIMLTMLLMGFAPAITVKADGSRTLFPSGATGDRGNLEFRTSVYASLLLRRTLIKVFAQQNEYILVGSTGAGIESGDIRIFAPGAVTGAIGSETIPATPAFSCVDQQATTPGAGLITSRAQELAGPDTVPASVLGAYTPCYYQAPATGIYDVVFWGPDGGNSDTNYNPDANNIDLTSPDSFTGVQGASLSAWDVTVRADLTQAVDINGRVFTYYLTMNTGGNDRPLNFSLYPVTLDGFRYKLDMNGMDPWGFVIFGNREGFYDSDGSTPLYHDVVGDNGNLDNLSGGTSIALPEFPLFFTPPDDLALQALGIPTTATQPVVYSLTYVGNAGGRNSYYAPGIPFGEFTLDSTAGLYEIIIQGPGVSNFDPADPRNRILRGVKDAGPLVVPWDGLANDGSQYPVGGPYQVLVDVHGGEYHFPFLDAENDINGGPIMELLNPPGGDCTVLGPNGCFRLFFDDRVYQTLSGVKVDGNEPPDAGTVVAVDPLCGNLAPAAPYHSDFELGFDSRTTTRAFGSAIDTGNANVRCLGSFGDTKGLDLWANYPSVRAQTDFSVVTNLLDFGDLPDPAYPTLLANNGPRHVIGSLFLGQGVSAETDGQPSLLADADTFDDGVTRVPSVQWLPNQTGQINVSVHGNNGNLVGWFDFDGNGDFTGTGEMIDFGSVISGTQVLNVPIPAAYTTGTALYARFRLYDGQQMGPTPTGLATNGEVEDYYWTFKPTAVTLASLTASSGLPWINSLLLLIVALFSAFGLFWWAIGRKGNLRQTVWLTIRKRDSQTRTDKH